MYNIELKEKLSIKELDAENQKDIWLARKLDEDKDVIKYLWSVEKELNRMRNHDNPYDTDYAVYLRENPIGYLSLCQINDISNLGEKANVCVSYAILKEKRRQGYASSVLKDISNIMLMDTIEKVYLDIECTNKASKKVARNAGFKMRTSPIDYFFEDYVGYEKDKNMLKREIILR